MRQLAILTFQTLDGVMQAPSMPEEDLSNGFRQGGWAHEYWGETMEQVAREAMAEPYDLLLGRVTYESFASHFSSADDDNPIAKKLNAARKYVVTSTLKQLNWQNSVQLTGNIINEITTLKQQQGPLIQVHGSWQLIQALHSNGLIDEYRLWTFPVLVGAGKRLFSDGVIPSHLQLVKFEASPSGVCMNIFRPRA